MFNKFFSQNRAFYEIMWKNIVEPGTPQMTIWRMYIACWIPKVTNTHQNIVLLLFQCNNACTNVIRTLPVLLFVYVLSPLLPFLYFFILLSLVKR
jgi:hypothetical protein